MKKIFLIALLALTFGATNAHAVAVTFNIDELYDWGRLYSYNENGTIVDPLNPSTWANAADDTYTTLNSNPGVVGDTPVGTVVPANTFGIADGKEDTWGVGNIASIKTIPDNTTLWQSSLSQELTFMFYGFDDNMLGSPIMGTPSLKSIGGHVSVWLDNTPDFDGEDGTSNRTSPSTWTGATEDILVLDLAPVVIDLAGTTLSSNFDFSTMAGSGSLYLSVTGLGLWDSLYDTNTQLFGSDFFLSYTMRDNVNPETGNWVVVGDGGTKGNAIPEPTSMILFATGLVGAALRKRFMIA